MNKRQKNNENGGKRGRSRKWETSGKEEMKSE